MSNTRKFKIGDLVKGRAAWYGRESYLDRRFVNEYGVVVGYDHQFFTLYLIQWPFGTYTLQESDLVLISEGSDETVSS